jgi:hypothetical protein
MRFWQVFLSHAKCWVSLTSYIISFLSYIYLGYFVCLCVSVCVCVSQFVSERSAILLVLLIKLTQDTRRRVWRGRDMDGEIRRGQIGEGGCEETFHCLSQTWVACRFTVPPAVALLNYISCGLLWRIFCQTGIFAGFSLHIINLAVRISEAAMWGVGTLYFLRGFFIFICRKDQRSSDERV